MMISLASLGLLAGLAGAADYTIDDAHSSLSFKVSHLGLSEIHGRFGEFSGTFSIDKEDPSKSAFALTIKTESVDTNNKKRDDHLRSPDFFNVKQFPAITFKSTEVKAVDGGLLVTGDLTMHGKTNSIHFTLKGGKQVEFPPKTKRTGYSTELTLKRSDYGMDKMTNAIGDEVPVTISFEGVQK
jgi:polyisoprenoid-binding protein YceI